MTLWNVTFCHKNYLLGAELSASSGEVPTLPVTNLVTELRREVFKTTDTDGGWVKAVFDMPRRCTAFGLVEHNLSPSAQVRLQANSLDSFSGETPYDETFTALEATVGFGQDGFGKWGFGGVVVPNQNRLQPPLVKFLGTDANGWTPEYRYWKWTISDPDNTQGYHVFGVAFLGDCYTPRRNFVRGLKHRIIDPTQTRFSEGRQPWSDRQELYSRVQFTIRNLTDQDKHIGLRQVFDEVGTFRDFILVLEPGTALGMQNMTFWGRFTGNMDFEQQRYDSHTVNIEFEETA